MGSGSSKSKAVQRGKTVADVVARLSAPPGHGPSTGMLPSGPPPGLPPTAPTFPAGAPGGSGGGGNGKLAQLRDERCQKIVSSLMESERLRQQLEQTRAEAGHELPNGLYPKLIFEGCFAASGQAVVYRARFPDAPVAAKIFGASQPGSTFSEASLCTTEERKHLAAFRNEAQVIWHINDPGHHCVISMLAFFEEPKPCLVTPFVAGGSLKQYVRAAERFNFSSAAILASGVSDGLAYLHSKGVVHRDMKSSNVLVDDSGCPVIIDFGLSCMDCTEGKTAFRVQRLLGTPPYMAPELTVRSEEGKGVCPFKADIYAVGIILWELCSKMKVPYTQADWDAFYEEDDGFVKGPGRPERALVVDEMMQYVRDGGRPAIGIGWPTRLVHEMERCWAHEPCERPGVNELTNDLKDASTSPHLMGLAAPPERKVMAQWRKEQSQQISGVSRLAPSVMDNAGDGANVADAAPAWSGQARGSGVHTPTPGPNSNRGGKSGNDLQAKMDAALVKDQPGSTHFRHSTLR